MLSLRTEAVPNKGPDYVPNYWPELSLTKALTLTLIKVLMLFLRP